MRPFEEEVASPGSGSTALDSRGSFAFTPRDKGEKKLANVVFAPIHDRRGRSILSMRDQNTFAEPLRRKRLMTLVHLFLVHRFKAESVHYVTPDEDNQYQAAKMK